MADAGQAEKDAVKERVLSILSKICTLYNMPMPAKEQLPTIDYISPRELEIWEVHQEAELSFFPPPSKSHYAFTGIPERLTAPNTLVLLPDLKDSTACSLLTHYLLCVYSTVPRKKTDIVYYELLHHTFHFAIAELTRNQLGYEYEYVAPKIIKGLPMEKSKDEAVNEFLMSSSTKQFYEKLLGWNGVKNSRDYLLEIYSDYCDMANMGRDYELLEHELKFNKSPFYPEPLARFLGNHLGDSLEKRVKEHGVDISEIGNIAFRKSASPARKLNMLLRRARS